MSVLVVLLVAGVLLVLFFRSRASTTPVAATDPGAPDDSMFDRVIKCPACGGHGETIAVFHGLEQGEETRFFFAPIGSGADVDEENSVLRRVRCSSCHGEGTAVARFAEEERNCQPCGGTGVRRVRRKAEVGMETVAETCGACGGKGSRVLPVVVAKTLQPSGGAVWTPDGIVEPVKYEGFSVYTIVSAHDIPSRPRSATPGQSMA
jgi:hypothetical protein